MKPLLRRAARAAFILFLLWGAGPSSEWSQSRAQSPKFDLSTHGFISSAIIHNGSSTQHLDGLAPTGQRLSVNVTSEDIQIPWTTYLPIHQFGAVTASRHFDVALTMPVLQGDTVAFRSDISSFRLLPELTRRSEARTQLDKIPTDAITIRSKEGNALNQRTKNGQGTAALQGFNGTPERSTPRPPARS